MVDRTGLCLWDVPWGISWNSPRCVHNYFVDWLSHSLSYRMTHRMASRDAKRFMSSSMGWPTGGQASHGMAYGVTHVIAVPWITYPMGRDASYRLSHERPMRCQALLGVSHVGCAIGGPMGKYASFSQSHRVGRIPWNPHPHPNPNPIH